LNQEDILLKAEEYIRKLLGNDGAGHDWWHIYRVVKLSKTINEHERANSFVVELAAWLHDIADHKFHGGDHSAGPREGRKWMELNRVDEEVIVQVENIIKEISFKGADVKTEMSTLEGKIVQDADRLDAIGAIGIARTFAYGGNRNRLMYDPSVKPVLHSDFESYKNSSAPTINHFYEKLLLLKTRMNTETAKKLAEKRHLFMEEYLAQFFDEWEGKK
jgi:uncharacterized protein